jgi:general secretion pathway protein B
MSFILDALKKSENERQRQSGPGLFEVKVAPPRARWPAWAYALAALLIINIGVVVWLTLRQPSHGETAPSAQMQTAAPVVPVPIAPTPQAPLVAPPPLAAPPAEIAEQQAPSEEAVDDTATGVADGANPDDYAPAVEPSTGTAAPIAGSQVTRGTVEGFPTYDEMSGKPGSGLPELRLDLHVYAVKPQERFVFLNMRRLREGDSLPEGVRVESITPDGTVLSFRGSKFVLERE